LNLPSLFCGCKGNI